MRISLARECKFHSFQKVYSQQMSLSELVAMLLRFKNSDNKREKAVFACMIHNLFDEVSCRCFARLF